MDWDEAEEKASRRGACLPLPTCRAVCEVFAIADLVHVAVGKDDQPVSISVQGAKRDQTLLNDLFRHPRSASGNRNYLWGGGHMRFVEWRTCDRDTVATLPVTDPATRLVRTGLANVGPKVQKTTYLH